MIGLAELIKLAAFADSCGVEVLEFSCRDGYGGCEMVGRHLNYLVSLDARSGVLSLHTSNADSLEIRVAPFRLPDPRRCRRPANGVGRLPRI